MRPCCSVGSTVVHESKRKMPSARTALTVAGRFWPAHVIGINKSDEVAGSGEEVRPSTGREYCSTSTESAAPRLNYRVRFASEPVGEVGVMMVLRKDALKVIDSPATV